MDRRTALCGLTGALITAAASPASAAPGASVTIDRSDGVGGGRRPAVLLLHGADGTTRRAQYQFAASALSGQGYTVLFPHYFELTGERRASYGEIGSKYPVWLGLLRRLVGQMWGDPAIDPSRLAVVGISLGGALALSLAAREPGIGAVISYCGFKPADLDQTSSRAPTLLLHGQADRVVPVDNAAAIEAALRARGATVETQIFPGEGHLFSQGAQLTAAARSAAFLARHLSG